MIQVSESKFQINKTGRTSFVWPNETPLSYSVEYMGFKFDITTDDLLNITNKMDIKWVSMERMVTSRDENASHVFFSVFRGTINGVGFKYEMKANIPPFLYEELTSDRG